jgi:hypothetical protein
MNMAEKALGGEREGSIVSSGCITPPLSSSLPNSTSTTADTKKEGQKEEDPIPNAPKKEKSKSATTSPVQISASKATNTTSSSFHSVSTSTSSTRSQLSDTSSFLSAKRIDPDGYPRVSRDVMRAKGLAEIVGREDFFVELHARFCMVLRSLVGESVR